MRLFQGIGSIVITLTAGIAGWQLCVFFLIYAAGGTPNLDANLHSYMMILPFFAAVGFLLALLISVHSLFFKKSAVIFDPKTYDKLRLLHLGYFIFLLADSWGYRLGYHIHLFELLIVSFSIWLVYLSGAIYYYSGERMYAHPTAIGSVFVKSVLTGLSLNILFPVIEAEAGIIPGMLTVLILLDLFILVASFRFLSQSSDETNRVARKLLGQYIFLFGGRIIVGTFIPLLIILYSISISNQELKGAAVLLISGVVLHTLVLILAGTDNTKESKSAR